MKNHLGIDHPLVAVRDMDKACQDFARLGDITLVLTNLSAVSLLFR